jgi:RHS repeat-associated protein
LLDRSLARADALNITGITDNVTAANSQTFGYTAANRLAAATGSYGAYSWSYDLVGNRTAEGITPSGGSLTTDTYAYPTTSNRIQTVTRGASTVRQMTYDGAGNMLTDNRAGATTTYTYNKRNRLASATSGALVWGYTYNGLEQLAVRTLTTGGTDITHFLHDIFGNVIAETGGGGATGTTGTLREYIWLPEAMIAPTMGSAAEIARPMAVVEDVETATPLLWFVHVDHLHRPVRMTSTAKATVWTAAWLPWGGVQSITSSGGGALNLRFPGQWFQLETGLHYNWHRSYDPSLGRYTQPDPLGFVDGPSVYGYAGGSPAMAVDPDGRQFRISPPVPRPTLPSPPTLGPRNFPGTHTFRWPPPPTILNKQNEYEYYKEICARPPPPDLTDPCNLAKWRLQKAYACYALRQAWDSKYPGSEEKHGEATDQSGSSIENAKNAVDRLCKDDPQSNRNNSSFPSSGGSSSFGIPGGPSCR